MNLIDTYIDTWNATDPDERSALIEKAWAADGARYRDPLLEADGLDGLADMIATVQAQYPAHVMRRTTGIDVHHDVARFGWELVAPGGDVLVAGIDVGLLADDGRLRTITGFFGEPPALDAAS